jgi:hypothetical protein
VHSCDPAMGLGFWAHHATWWSLATFHESGSEEAVMVRRDPHTTKALEISVLFEPSRLSPACVAQAYEAVVPLTQRMTSRASHRELAGREHTRQPRGRRAAS